MTADPRQALRAMLERFLRGDDRSLRFANEIEDLLDREFRGTAIHEELIEDLARYRPGGGPYLLNEEALAKKIDYVISVFLTKDP